MGQITMQTRAAMIQAAIAAAWLLAATANAQPIATTSLVQPSNLLQVSASPSGSRVAGLRSEHGQVFLWVSPLQAGQLRPVVSTYYLSRFHSIDSYQWLNDDYLLLQVEDLVNGLQEPVVVGISHNIWRPLPVFSELLQYPWGSGHQALLQESGADCRAPEMQFCLFLLNVDHWGGDRISEPLRLLPVDFLPVSPAEVYASGRSVLGPGLLGRHEEYRLDGDRWHRVADGTVAAQRARLAKTRQASASMIEAAARVGIRHPTFVRTVPGQRVVGVIGHAPEPAFVALDPRLEGLQSFLASHYPDARVSISSLDDSLTHAQVTVWDTDLPPTTYFLQSDGRMANYAPANPSLPADRLGQTHMEPVWAPGSSVAVTMPPRGVTTLGAVVTPVLAADGDLEDALHEYRPQVQALAQQGIAVVQMLSPIPAAFASNSDGASWHAAFDARLQQVVDSASSNLLHGAPVCLYGEGLAGELTLASGALAHVGCTVAVNPILNARYLSKVQVTGVPAGAWGGLTYRLLGPTTEMLERNFPAAFGNSHDQLDDSTSWVHGIPDRLMLGYDQDRYVNATRGFSVGEFADGSGAFRAAARKAGKQVDVYMPDPRFVTFLQREARMIDAVSRYVYGYYASTAPVAPRD